MTSSFVASVETSKTDVTTQEEFDALRAEFIQELNTLEVREGLRSRVILEARIFTHPEGGSPAYPMMDF